MSKAHFPRVPSNAKKFSSADYQKWWRQVHGEYFDKNITNLISQKLSETPSKDKDCGDGSHDENNQSSSHTHVDRGESQSVELVEVEGKSKTRSFERSSGADADRHWKRFKKDPNSSKPTGDAANNPQHTSDKVIYYV